MVLLLLLSLAGLTVGAGAAPPSTMTWTIDGTERQMIAGLSKPQQVSDVS